MDVARAIERRGYAAIPHTAVTTEQAVKAADIAPVTEGSIVGTVITSAPLEPGSTENPGAASADLLSLIRTAAGQRLVGGEKESAPLASHIFGALKGDVRLMGFASADRLDALAKQIADALDLEAMAVNVIDSGGIHGPVEPKEAHRTKPIIKRPSDWLPGAKSVVVLGCAIPETTVNRATEPPADGAGPYAYATYQTRRELRYAAYQVALALEGGGHRATVVDDVLGTASEVTNPRQRQPDAFASRFAAVAAGLGTLLHTGAVWAPPFGTLGRFIAVVTDAQLDATPLFTEEAPCANCPKPCVEACPTCALSSETVTVQLDGQTIGLGALDWLRCDWAKKYGLVAAEGPKYMGSQTDIAPPDAPITTDDIVKNYAQLDPVQKHWMCIVEPCLRACHLQMKGGK